MRGRILLFGILVVLLTSALFFEIPGDSVAVGAPIITLAFEEGEEEQTADVRPGEHGSVVFPGTVRADMAAGSSVQNVVVTLQASTDLNWPTTVQPDQLSLEPGEEQSFTVTVSVPPETSYYISETVTVDGRAQPFPGTGVYAIPPITGVIRIAQFYKYTLECDKPSEEVNYGSKCLYNIRIWNYGNGRDTYSISIPDLAQLVQKGFTVTLGTSTLEVDEKSSRTVSIQVETPNDEKCIGNHLVSVEVRSTQQEEVEGTTTPKHLDLNLKVVKEKQPDSGPGADNYPRDEPDNTDSERVDEPLPGFEGSQLILAVVILSLILFNKRKNG